MLLRRRHHTSATDTPEVGGAGDGAVFVNEPVPAHLLPEPPESLSPPEPAAGAAPDEVDGLVEIDIRGSLEPPKRRFSIRGAFSGNAWRVGAMVVLAIIGIYSLSRATAPDDATEDQQTLPVASTTTAAPVTPSVTTLPPIVTTTPPSTTAAPTTTTTTSTTTTSTTTTTTTTTPPPTIAVVGDPIDVQSLTLSILGIGPLEFGDPADAVLGRLAATFGQPDADSGEVTDGALGTCTEGTFRVVTWGALSIITRFTSGSEIFDSFRIDLRNVAEPGPAGSLQTLSGFAAGATVGELEAIYIPGFRIVYRTHPVEGEIYELSSNQGLLLWGPITSSDDSGIVQGLFSPETC